MQATLIYTYKLKTIEEYDYMIRKACFCETTQKKPYGLDDIILLKEGK